jgi:soluble lytic murein transglycosylase-like protein
LLLKRNRNKHPGAIIVPGLLWLWLAFMSNICIAATANSSMVIDTEIVDLLKKTVNDASSFDDKFEAEVWLVDMSRRLERYVSDPQQRLDWLRQIHQEAARAELVPELVLSVIYIESRFDSYAVSSAGAQGLMQVMPFWKNEIGRPEDNLTKVSTNLRYGCTILKHYIDKEKGNLTRALARYNGSLGKTWYPEKVLNAWEKYWFVKQQ